MPVQQRNLGASSLGPQHARSEPRPKRSKIDVACETCRLRKVKCDGVRPACGNCARRFSLRGTCQYTQTSSGSGTTSGDTQPALLAVHASPRFESGSSSVGPPPRAIRSGDDQRNPSASKILTPSPATDPGITGGLEVQGYQTNPSPRDAQSRDIGSRSTGSSLDGLRSQRTLSSNGANPSATDSMTVVPDQGTSTYEYFGSSSAGSFTAQIKKCLDARQRKTVPAQENDEVIVVKNPDQGHHRKPENYVLPPRRQADHLMGLYWTYVDPLYPFLDRSKCQKSYEATFLGAPTEIEERMLMAILNVIFALSTHLEESWTHAEREESSKTYFRRAQDLVALNTWEGFSVDVVQYLLLTSQYLQSTDCPHKTWMAVGSAIRIAQSLGLHLPETSADRRNQNERELFRRIWYGCVLMDRMVAMTHGRPAMIPSHLASAVPLPLYSFRVDEGTTQILGNSPTHASFFVKSIELYEIIYRTILAFYHSGNKGQSAIKSVGYETSSDEEDVQVAVQLDRELWKLERNLPETLRWSTSYSESFDRSLHREAVILHIRLLHARILVLRPFLARFCLSPRMENSGLSDSLQARVVQQCALLCVSTAKSIIAALYYNQATDGTVGPLPAWWYRVYYVYTAATILIAANLRPEVFPATELSQAWGQAMSILQAHERFGPSSRRCVAALHVLMRKISQDYHFGNVNANAEYSHSVANRAGNGQSAAEGIEADTNLFLPPVDEFAFSFDDFNEIEVGEVDFDINNLTWLNDLQGTWELLND